MNFREWAEDPKQLYLRYFKQIGMPLLVFRELWKSLEGWFQDGSNMGDGNSQETFQRILQDPWWKNTLNSRWTLEKIMVKPSDFTIQQQELLKQRKFGEKEAAWGVPNDLARTANQKQIINRQLPGENQPVIIIKVGNKYDLIEGWHRSMNVLLQGKPDDLLLAREFKNWKRVPLQAWVGIPGIASSISFR